MLDVAHGIMFVGTCMCIMSFCVGFSLERNYQERKESQTVTEEEVKSIINEAVVQALGNIRMIGKNKP